MDRGNPGAERQGVREGEEGRGRLFGSDKVVTRETRQRRKETKPLVRKRARERERGKREWKKRTESAPQTSD